MRCQACGFDNPPGMRFCGQCGTPLTPPTPSVEERKLVTILFADAVGSTRLSGTADPEQVRAQMGRFFAIAQDEIRKYGGTLEKFIGDAVMAVFGLPAVHEDDPERAVRAAASIKVRLRPDVASGAVREIRIGIATGEVVASPQAAAAGDFLVTGEAVNIAARLQQLAAPGQILLGERTAAALHHVVHQRLIPPLSVKGVDAPLAVWELVDVTPPRGRDVRSTPFVGRAEELNLLAGHVRRMRREGRGHVVTILGPAGVGKTRLIQEFQSRTEGAHSLLGRALPYGTGVPFGALGQAIRDECGILIDDPLDVARRKLQESATRLGISEAVPALLAVLGLGAEVRDLTREILFSRMRALFQAIAKRAPLLLILEDVHSADDVTLDFVEHAADWFRGQPALLLVLARPDLLDRRPTWMGGKRNATTLVLDPLPGDESRELVRAILGGQEIPPGLLDLVLERAEGNPLFIEEMLRAMVERGTLAQRTGQWALTVPLDQVAIPDSVNAVIAARIDALPALEKQVLQTAAVAGKDFWLGTLRFIAGEDHVDEAVRALVGKDLLTRKPQSRMRDEEEFTFRHILIRDVAYAMLPKSQRWPKHARCAEWVERIAGDRRAEYADIMAHHWLQAIALRADLGLPPDAHANEKAIANLLVAGERAAGLYANTTALDHYGRALDMDPPLSDRLRALLGRGEVWMLLGQHERAREDFASARTLAHEHKEPRWEAVALDHLGHSYRRQDQIAQALQHLEPALALSRDVGDSSLAGRILNHIGFTYFSGIRHEEAIRVHQEARTLLEASGDMPGLAESLHGLGDNLVLLGQYQEAIRWLSESAKVSEQTGNRSLAAENGYMIAIAQERLGEYADAEAHAQRSVATLSEIGDVWNLSIALWSAAEIATTLGKFDTALEGGTRGLALARQIGTVRFTINNLLGLGRLYREMEAHHSAWQCDSEAVHLASAPSGWAGWQLPFALASLALDSAALGKMDEAQAHIREARQALTETQSGLDFDQEVSHAEARVLLILGRHAQARRTARSLAEGASATGRLYWRVPAMLILADAAAASRQWADAMAAYTSVAEEAERAGRTPALWRALAGLAEAQEARGQKEDAAQSARRAREIVERLAGALPDERLRATFLQSAIVQRVMALAGS